MQELAIEKKKGFTFSTYTVIAEATNEELKSYTGWTRHELHRPIQQIPLRELKGYDPLITFIVPGRSIEKQLIDRLRNADFCLNKNRSTNDDTEQYGYWETQDLVDAVEKDVLRAIAGNHPGFRVYNPRTHSFHTTKYGYWFYNT